MGSKIQPPPSNLMQSRLSHVLVKVNFSYTNRAQKMTPFLNSTILFNHIISLNQFCFFYIYQCVRKVFQFVNTLCRFCVGYYCRQDKYWGQNIFHLASLFSHIFWSPISFRSLFWFDLGLLPSHEKSNHGR